MWVKKTPINQNWFNNSNVLGLQIDATYFYLNKVLNLDRNYRE